MKHLRNSGTTAFPLTTVTHILRVAAEIFWRPPGFVVAGDETIGGRFITEGEESLLGVVLFRLIVNNLTKLTVTPFS